MADTQPITPQEQLRQLLLVPMLMVVVVGLVIPFVPVVGLSLLPLVFIALGVHA